MFSKLKTLIKRISTVGLATTTMVTSINLSGLNLVNAYAVTINSGTYIYDSGSDDFPGGYYLSDGTSGNGRNGTLASNNSDATGRALFGTNGESVTITINAGSKGLRLYGTGISDGGWFVAANSSETKIFSSTGGCKYKFAGGCNGKVTVTVASAVVTHTCSTGGWTTGPYIVNDISYCQRQVKCTNSNCPASQNTKYNYTGHSYAYYNQKKRVVLPTLKFCLFY